MDHLSRRSLLAAGVVILAGCKTTTTYMSAGDTHPSTTAPSGGSIPTRGPIVSIAMVGDSITRASESALRDDLTQLGIDNDDIIIDGETSRRIANGNGKNGNTLSGARAVTALLEAGTDPSVWVIALGTNDVGLFGTPQECAELIEQITDLLPPPIPLVWVNVYRSGQLRQTRIFNEVLEGRIEARGDAVVADWYSIASDPDTDVLRSDNIHPNETGKLAFAELVAQALQRL
ncbi:MAG: hypothetical protein K8R99_05635 [Actinomycetia bacterium]|nr:hypothetical protein [Actinomycetes bacterium]